MMLGVIICSLLAGFILTLFDFDDIVCDVAREWFGITLSTSGYYAIFVIGGFFVEILKFVF